MELYVVRHAIAEERTIDRPDEGRRLTTGGRSRFKHVVRGLERLNVRFDTLLHSPWLRAVETADLLESLCVGSRQATDRLAEPPDDALLGELEGDRVALVGHEPWMSELVVLLTSGAQADWGLAFKKGGVAWLRGTPEAGGMVLRALIPPKVFVELADRVA